MAPRPFANGLSAIAYLSRWASCSTWSPVVLCGVYAEMLGEMDSRYPDAWGLIYQTDVRTRNEHAPRAKANCVRRHARAIAKTPPEDSEFDPARPWAQVFVELISSEEAWWAKRIRLPGIELLAKVANPEKKTLMATLLLASGRVGQCVMTDPLPH